MAGRSLVLLTIIALTAPSAGAGARIPEVVGETLAGQRILLPSGIAQPAAILILGFTQKAGEQAEKWRIEVGKLRSCAKDQPIEWYEMPVLSSVPRLVRPLVIRAMRSELVPELRSHFLPVYSEESSWKAAIGFSVRDDPYVAIVSRDGNLKFSLHGVVDPAKLSQLREQLRAACVEP